MHWLQILSLAIRLAACLGSLVLLLRLRDRRLAALCALLAALVLQQALALQAIQAGSLTGSGPSPTSAWIDLIVSLSTLPAVLALGRLARHKARTERLAKVFSVSPDAIVLSSLPDGEILESNAGFTRLVGYRPEEVVGRTPQELRLWADHAERIDLMERLDREGRAHDRELPLRHKDGHVVDCRVASEIVDIGGDSMALSVLHDTTARKRAERALRISEEMFSKAFSASPDAITVSSLKEGTFIEVNESFHQVTGYSREETLGRTSIELGLWSDPADRDRFRAAVREGRSLSEQEIIFRHRSGEKILCLVSADVIEFQDAPNLLMTVRDITDRKRAEEERFQLIGQLEAKNEELERFAYTLSHDLKSPLVTISGFLGLLERDIGSGNNERVASDLKRIRGAADNMSRLVDELLELSRIGRVIHPNEEVALAELATIAAEAVAGRIADRGAQLSIEPDLPIVVGDRVRLIEVLQNLIENAVKFMGEQPDPRIEVGVTRRGADSAVYVRDNGLGIDPRYHEKIFDLFDRLHPEVEGTGLGLALVKRIIEVHGGRIWVESEGPGTGSTFLFTLPAQPPGASDKPL